MKPTMWAKCFIIKSIPPKAIATLVQRTLDVSILIGAAQLDSRKGIAIDRDIPKSFHVSAHTGRAFFKATNVIHIFEQSRRAGVE